MARKKTPIATDLDLGQLLGLPPRRRLDNAQLVKRLPLLRQAWRSIDASPYGPHAWFGDSLDAWDGRRRDLVARVNAGDMRALIDLVGADPRYLDEPPCKRPGPGFRAGAGEERIHAKARVE